MEAILVISFIGIVYYLNGIRDELKDIKGEIKTIKEQTDIESLNRKARYNFERESYNDNESQK